MRVKKNLFAAMAVLFLVSCSANQQVTYFQDLEYGKAERLVEPEEITMMPGDKISIVVNSKEPK